jgi:hypothetical protein
MKNQIFCHHHQRDRQRQANLRAGLAAKFRAGEEDLNAEIVASLDLPAPDDPEAVLVCLSNTFRALAAGAIPEKRAALMIYNLQTINIAVANALRYRADLQESAARGERAVTDPEPIASFLSSNRQADYEFSAQQYAGRLETQLQTQRRPFDSAQGRLEDAEDSLVCHSERAERVEESLGTPRTVVDSFGTTGVSPVQTDAATLEAAFNADAARMQALEHGDLARPAEAPHSPEEVEAAVHAMSSDDWEKYVQHLWLCGFVDDAQREKLHARIFHADRNVRAAARFLVLKYAPGKVREVLAHSSQSQVAGSQKER